MKLEIERNPKVLLKDIKLGECFLLSGFIYLKIYEPERGFNAVLMDGKSMLYIFELNQMVEPVDATLIITRL